ncbi:DUF4350 domain-containing protein [Gimesia panareensis]|uniref:DUF4350 domain-containing protein n=1 Tax=Gimesia panareensis TaxID=2527978 RepID=UPI0011A475AB|nr:DUF4350 domain-containing protein [Gimesia panareensis]
MKSPLEFRSPLFHMLFFLLLQVQPLRLPAAEQSESVAVEQVQVGFGGLYKVGRWVPVTLNVTTTEAIDLQFTITAISPDGNPTEAPSQVYSCPQPGPYQLQSLFKAGLMDCPLKIRLRESETQSILKEFTYTPRAAQNQFTGIGLEQSVELWATIGKISGYQTVVEEDLETLNQNLNRYTSLISDQKLLPENAYGYDTLDTLIVDGDYSVSGAKNRAIRDWVANGGHLVMCVGNQLEDYQKSEFARWIPVKTPGTSRVREMSSLELFAAVRSRIRGVATAARIEIETGEVLATSLDGPLLVRVPYGLGMVTFLGLDLNTSPLLGWEGLKNLCPKLAYRRIQSGGTGQKNMELGKRISQTGISELETQMFHSQQNFLQVQRVSHWWVMGLILVYLLIIGPLDYVVVHRLLKKPHITWFTFPTMVILAAGWGVLTAQQSNGNQLHTTQLNVADYDATTGQLRGRFYLNLYSPETRRYQVKVMSQIPAPTTTSDTFPTHLCWNGLPENTFAGMYRSAEGTITGPAYQFTPDSSEIENLPVLKWGTKSLLGDWSQQQPDLLASDLTGTSLGQLSGKLTHHFSGPLKEWVLAYGNRIYLPLVNPEQLEASYIPANQSWDINGPGIESRNIKGYLTRSVSRRIAARGANAGNVVTEQTDYNAFSKNAYEILKMLTFHETAGGFGYTGLSNIAAEQLDLTEQLRLGRAVLFARLGTPLSQVQLDDESLSQDQQDTYLRVVIPVKRSNEIQYELPSLEEDDKKEKEKAEESPNQQDTPSGSEKE